MLFAQKINLQEMAMSGRLNGKRAIITGAANGIGRASAILFAREGANLVLADVNETGLQQAEEEIKKIGGNVIIRKTDVSSEDEIKALINLALEKFNTIDILVNNAGIGVGISDTSSTYTANAGFSFSF